MAAQKRASRNDDAAVAVHHVSAPSPDLQPCALQSLEVELSAIFSAERERINAMVYCKVFESIENGVAKGKSSQAEIKLQAAARLAAAKASWSAARDALLQKCAAVGVSVESVFAVTVALVEQCARAVLAPVPAPEAHRKDVEGPPAEAGSPLRLAGLPLEVASDPSAPRGTKRRRRHRYDDELGAHKARAVQEFEEKSGFDFDGCLCAFLGSVSDADCGAFLRSQEELWSGKHDVRKPCSFLMANLKTFVDNLRYKPEGHCARSGDAPRGGRAGSPPERP